MSGEDTVSEQAQRREISVDLSGSDVDPRSSTVTETITHKKLQKLEQTDCSLCSATMSSFFCTGCRLSEFACPS